MSNTRTPRHSYTSRLRVDDLQLGDDAEPRAVLDSLNRVDQIDVGRRAGRQ